MEMRTAGNCQWIRVCSLKHWKMPIRFPCINYIKSRISVYPKLEACTFDERQMPRRLNRFLSSIYDLISVHDGGASVAECWKHATP